VGAVWLDLALLEQGELFAQEEVLGSQCAARPANEREAKVDSVLGLFVSSWKMEPA